MELSKDWDGLGTASVGNFEKLVKLLNDSHDLDLPNSDKYFFTSLYTQILRKLDYKVGYTNKNEFQEELMNMFSNQVLELEKANQLRFEIIMSDREIRSKVIDYLSESVYNNLTK